MANNLDTIFDELKIRYSELQNTCDKESFVKHLCAIALWNNEPMDYPEVSNVKFPEGLHIAHAVCHPECGVQEFIVDGSTQKCQKCGRSMFRGEVEFYSLKEKK